MNPPEPPTFMLLWCPVCGRHDNFGRSLLNPRHYVKDRRDTVTLCEGRPIRLPYKAVNQPKGA